MSTTVSILSLVAAIINLGRALISRIRMPSAKQRAAKAAHDARAASAQGDAPKVNSLTERHRIDELLPIALAAVLLATAGCGCSLLRDQAEPADDYPPAVVIVPADRYQYPMTNAAGVVGWFVPVAVHIEFMEALVLVDYYRSKDTTKGNTR